MSQVGTFLVPAMAADVIDYDELRTGKRREAQYTAFWALISTRDEHTDPFTNAVRVTMTTLRKKLGEPSPIETVVGAGYVIR